MNQLPQLPNRLTQGRLECGVDEVGRGCLAGPVVAAAVIIPENFVLHGLNDSKKLSAKVRKEMDSVIRAHALAYGIGEASPEEIDRLNILQATFLAMKRALLALPITPEYILVDGNRFKSDLDIPYETLIGGDGKVASIAAASVLAKVYRDTLMQEASKQYPGYGWEKNVGYGTAAHLQAIRTKGLTPLHRLSFRPCRPTLFQL